MPITKDVNGVIQYVRKKDLWSSDVTGVFSDKDFAISSENDPLKQLKADLDPLPTDTTVVLKANAGTNDDLELTLPGESGTIALVGDGGSLAFTTIQVPNGTSPVATGPTDTLTLEEGANIEIEGDSTTDSVTISLVDSPALTGNPTAPDQAPLDSSTKIANTKYVDDAVAAGGGGGGTWGSITGTLSDQTDLQSALDAKAPIASPTFTGTVSGVTKAMVGLGNVTDDAQLKSADLDTDGTLSANSASKIPAQSAVKTYVDTTAAGIVPSTMRFLAAGNFPVIAETTIATLSTAQASQVFGVVNNIIFVHIYVPKAATITGLAWIQRVTGNYTPGAYNGVALYSFNKATTVVTKIAETGDIPTIWTKTANSFNTQAFQAPVAVAAGDYFLGFLYTNSASVTNPTLAGLPSTNFLAPMPNGITITARAAASSGPASTYTLNAVSANANAFFGALY